MQKNIPSTLCSNHWLQVKSPPKTCELLGVSILGLVIGDWDPEVSSTDQARGNGPTAGGASDLKRGFREMWEPSIPKDLVQRHIMFLWCFWLICAYLVQGSLDKIWISVLNDNTYVWFEVFENLTIVLFRLVQRFELSGIVKCWFLRFFFHFWCLLKPVWVVDPVEPTMTGKQTQ